MDEDSPTDADLVSDTLAGNRESFGQLYDRYARIVRAVVAGVSGDWSSVEDMVQESFLRGYRNLARLREPQRFGRWIVGIARQVGRERRRSLRRDRHEFRDPRPWELESAGDAEAGTAEHEQLQLAMRTLDQLEERERIAVHAFFLQQQGVGQSAELLGLSRSGFYALVQRTIARLAAQLKPCETRK